MSALKNQPIPKTNGNEVTKPVFKRSSLKELHEQVYNVRHKEMDDYDGEHDDDDADCFCD